MNEHALSVHSVNAEGLARLQSLINGSHWLNNKQEKENSQHDEEDSLRSSLAEKGMYSKIFNYQQDINRSK